MRLLNFLLSSSLNQEAESLPLLADQQNGGFEQISEPSQNESVALLVDLGDGPEKKDIGEVVGVLEYLNAQGS